MGGEKSGVALRLFSAVRPVKFLEKFLLWELVRGSNTNFLFNNTHTQGMIFFFHVKLKFE